MTATSAIDPSTITFTLPEVLTGDSGGLGAGVGVKVWEFVKMSEIFAADTASENRIIAGRRDDPGDFLRRSDDFQFLRHPSTDHVSSMNSIVCASMHGSSLETPIGNHFDRSPLNA
jgi:hypothetical protein